MSYDSIEISYPADSVVKVVINRPRQFNALNHQTLEELSRMLREFENSDHEFLILTGAGRAFCFGADFEEFDRKESLLEMLDRFQRLILDLYHCSKITVASLNGFATGAGLDLAMACDFRIAAEKIKLAEAYISMGLVPDGGGSYFLPHLIGQGRALEMMLTGEPISAETALQMGLVNRVCPLVDLAENTLQFIAALAGKPKKARHLTKKLLKNPCSTLEAALQNERDAQLSCFEDPDHNKLATEFLKKRKKA